MSGESSQVRDLHSLPTLCARQDHGAGVRLSSYFSIYTLTSLPPTFLTTAKSLNILDDLTSLAAEISSLLPVHVSLPEKQNNEFYALPVPPGIIHTHPTRPRSNANPPPPMFVAHAAQAKKHCVIGRGSELEALLCVLRRPWCVLELCCTSLEAVTAIGKLAQLAGRVEEAEYAAASAILEHELRVRQARTTPATEAAKLEAAAEILKRIYAASENSFNGAWLRALCVVAVRMTVGFREVLGWVNREVHNSSFDEGNTYKLGNGTEFCGLDQTQEVKTTVSREPVLEKYAEIMEELRVKGLWK